ncbi:hypothetical protein [Erythrobacter sp. MTPC3]|uniref:hypothetical protein n=1 Tax=Erythrobacter sp. MTPC3 TaxID=3056564 RepID=UPI0036F43018
MVILSMVFIAIGFLTDAISPLGAADDAPPTKAKLLLIIFGVLALAAMWSYTFSRTLRGDAVDWVLAAIQLVGIAVMLFAAIRHLGQVRQAA